MRRFRLRRRVFPAAVIIVSALAIVAGRTWLWPLPDPAARPGRWATVTRVVDGDTLLLDDGQRVRLLGVDTPEIGHHDRPVEPLGPEASEFTRREVEGRRVWLEFDRERRDEYGRLLAYVYRDGWFLNAELIRAGFSPAMTRFPYAESMKRTFRAAEAEARRNRVGRFAR